jgi:hypothetical protein
MRTGNPAHSIILRLTALLMLACCTRVVQAGWVQDVQFSKPITSAQYEATLREARLPVEERAALDAAFDTYVDDWQRLRDRTLRPLRVELEDVNARGEKELETVRSQIAERDATPEQTPEQEQESSAGYARALQARNAERAAMRAKIRQAHDRIGQLDARLISALKAGPRTPEQILAIDKLAQDRARRLASAMIRSTVGWRSSPVLAKLPGAPKDLDPKVAAAFADRMATLEAQALPLLQRLAQASFADDEQGEAERAADDALIALRLKAIGEIGATLPASVQTQWVDSARTRMLQGVTWGADRAPTAAIIDAIGDRMDDAARKRLDRWTVERQTIENELMGRTTDWAARNGRMEALAALNAQAMKDLAESTRTPALAEPDFVMKANLAAMRDADPAELRAGLGGEDSDFGAMEQRMTDRLAEMNGAADEADAASQAPADAREASMMAVQQRPLQRLQVNRLRDALGIGAEQRDVWDALADDLLEASNTLHDSKALKATDMTADPKEAMAALLRSSEYRTEQQALENRWLDSIAATFTSIPRDTLADQRSRWTFRRLRDLSGMTRMVAMMTGDRSGDLDLDAAIDRLPSAVRAALGPQVLASRERRIRDLQASIESTESFMRTMARMSEGLVMGQQPDPEQMNALLKAQQEYMATAQKRARQAAAAQHDEVEAMANALPAPAAGMLRRAIEAQQYPEVFRPMQRTDGMIERVMSLPDLSVKQIAALDAEVDAFRVKSDAVAERAIATITEADKAQSDMISGEGDPSDAEASMERFARMRASQTSAADLDYDRSELSARTLRRLRALLSPEQAAAAKLD